MTSDRPIIAGKKPIIKSLEPNQDYYWCSCGRSQNQPYCDGSHKGTEFNPIRFQIKKHEEVALCQCKGTSNPPYCDGSHNNIANLTVGDINPVMDDKNRKNKATATPDEPYVAIIHELAKNGLRNQGHHGEIVAMGVSRNELPEWKDIQILPAQLAKTPLQDDCDILSEIVIGPRSKKPIKLKIPILISDMSFGAISEEAKVSLSKGAEIAGTGICSGEGGMLPDEQKENSRYFYELASAKFGWDINLIKSVQAFHFKGGQGAKTGVGGHLPGNKVHSKIAEVRNIPEGQDAISPSTFSDLSSIKDYKYLADQIRDVSGGIPIGFKISANHIEDDIDFALNASADYIILDGRGGGTGAAPKIIRDNISIPTIPALARARKHLDKRCGNDVTLIITGGLRVADDFIKALALGADGIAIANSAIQAIGCVGARMCNTNNCPSGIATQKPELRKLINIDTASKQLANFLLSSTELMKVLARACGHDSLSKFSKNDLTTWKSDIAKLSGIKFAGVNFEEDRI